MNKLTVEQFKKLVIDADIKVKVVEYESEWSEEDKDKKHQGLIIKTLLLGSFKFECIISYSYLDLLPSQIKFEKNPLENNERWKSEAPIVLDDDGDELLESETEVIIFFLRPELNEFNDENLTIVQ